MVVAEHGLDLGRDLGRVDARHGVGRGALAFADQPLEEYAKVPVVLVRLHGGGARGLRGEEGADVRCVDAVGVAWQLMSAR